MKNGRGRIGWWQRRIKPAHEGASVAGGNKYEIVEGMNPACYPRAVEQNQDLQGWLDEYRKQYVEPVRRDAISKTFRNKLSWQRALAKGNTLRANDANEYRQGIRRVCPELIHKRGAVPEIQQRMCSAGYGWLAVSTIRAHLKIIRATLNR